MMLRSNVATLPHRASRTRTVTVRAFKTDNSPFAGLMRIFTPDKYIDSKYDWENTGASFKGDRMRNTRNRKPFKDGYTAQKQQARKMTRQQSEEQEEERVSNAPSGLPGFLSYLNQAAERVVGNNFTGDETEPDWSKLGSRGWSGDVRRKNKKGPFNM